MRASASLRIEAVGGRSVAVDVRSEPPFAVRRAGARFLVVGAAAAPVRGDRLELSIEVGAGAWAGVGSVAATMVWPGPDGGTCEPSQLTTTIRVGPGAHLVWRPEPTVSVAGSDHVARTVVELAPDATCELVEEYSLGRCGEPSGRLTTELRIVRDGRPLIHHGERFGPDEPGAGGVAQVGAFRHVVAAAVVGVPAGASVVEVPEPDRGSRGPAEACAAWLPVAGDAGLALAAAPDRPAARQTLAAVLPTS